MRVKDLQNGQMCTRPNWGSANAVCLAIYKSMETLYYVSINSKANLVREYSSAYDYRDFKLVEYEGQRLPNNDKEPQGDKMKLVDIKIIVAQEKGGLRLFEGEQEALEYIVETLEGSPRAKFVMFKPYQKVEPKQISLADLITKL